MWYTSRPRPMDETTSRYVHGTDPEEQRRLSGLNELLNQATLRETGVQRGERILDFGSGLGQLTRALARAAGTPAVGIEHSAEQLDQARRMAAEAGESELVDFRSGNVLDPPLRDEEWATFDLVHARFILEHVRDPLRVVRHMVRTARPGGRIVLADDDHDVFRHWPEVEGFAELWRAYIAMFDRLGYDGAVGRKLPSLLHEAGAKPVRTMWIWFGGCAGEPRFPALISNLIAVIDGARDDILRPGGFDAARYDRTIAALREWTGRPDASLWFSMCWAEGARLSG